MIVIHGTVIKSGLTHYRGMLFYRLAQQAVAIPHVPFRNLVMVRDGLRRHGGVKEICLCRLYVLLGQYQPRRLLMFPPARVGMAVRLIDTRTGEVSWSAQQNVGGVKRWLTWFFWPLGAVATAFSPSAEDLLAVASRRVCKALRREL